MGRKNNTNRMNSVQKLYSDFSKNASKADLLSVLVNKDFLIDNPSWLLDGSYDSEIIYGLFNLGLCADLTDDDLLNIADTMLKILNGLKNTRNDETNYTNLMNKFVTVAKESDEVSAICEDTYGLIKAEYLDTFSDTDATRLAVAVVLQSALADILQINNLGLNAASSSLEDSELEESEEDMEEEDMSKKNTTPVNTTPVNTTPVNTTPETDNNSELADFSKFRKGVKYRTATKADRDGKNDKNAVAVVEPTVKTPEETLEDKEKKVDEKMASLSASLIKDVFPLAVLSVNAGTTFKLTDDQIMDTLNKVVPKVIGSSYSVDKVLAVDVDTATKELNKSIISTLIADIVAESMTNPTTVAASNSTKDSDKVDPLTLFTEKHGEMVISKFPELKDIVTPANVVTIVRDAISTVMNDGGTDNDFITMMMQTSDMKPENILQLVIFMGKHGKELGETVKEIINNIDGFKEMDAKLKAEKAEAKKAETAKLNKERLEGFRESLRKDQDEKPDRKIDVEAGAQVRLAWAKVADSLKESKPFTNPMFAMFAR